jgi:hypothetical protein
MKTTLSTKNRIKAIDDLPQEPELVQPIVPELVRLLSREQFPTTGREFCY